MIYLCFIYLYINIFNFTTNRYHRIILHSIWPIERASWSITFYYLYVTHQFDFRFYSCTVISRPGKILRPNSFCTKKSMALAICTFTRTRKSKTEWSKWMHIDYCRSRQKYPNFANWMLCEYWSKSRWYFRWYTRL